MVVLGQSVARVGSGLVVGLVVGWLLAIVISSGASAAPSSDLAAPEPGTSPGAEARPSTPPDSPIPSRTPPEPVAETLDQPVAYAGQGIGAPLSVGDIEQLDLEQLRAVIAATRPVDVRADVEVRELSLEECLQLALTNNLEIQIGQAGVDVGEASISEAKARFHPTVGALGNAEGYRFDRNNGRDDETRNREQALGFVEQEVPTGGKVRLGVGYDRIATSKNPEDASDPNNFDNSNVLAGLSIEVFQPLLRGGRTYVARSQIIDSEYGDEINRALLSSSMLRVKAATKTAYYNAVRAKRQVEVVERALVRDQQLVEASNALYEAGQVSKVDVHSSEFSKATDEARIATSRAELRLQENELRRVMGLPVGVRVVPTETSIPFEPVSVDLTGWITRALRNRPELLQMRAQLDQAVLGKKIARNGKLPELGVTGGFQPGFDWASYNWNAGLSFSMPIGNRGPAARFRQAEGARSLAHSQLLQKQRDIELEVRRFEIRLRENVERIDSLSRAVESARAKREVAAGRFELGLASNLDIVNADEELIRAESQLLTAVADHAATLAQLEASIGSPLY